MKVRFLNSETVHDVEITKTKDTVTLTDNLPADVTCGFEILDEDGNVQESRELYTVIVSRTINSVTLTHPYYPTHPSELEQLRADVDYLLMLEG